MELEGVQKDMGSLVPDKIIKIVKIQKILFFRFQEYSVAETKLI